MGLIKRERVQLSSDGGEAPTRARGGGPRHGAHAGPKSARLVRLEGRVVGIEFTCSCGQSSLLEIDFDGDSPADPEEA
ncbi:MAG: hypothetical protein AAFZ65_06315 [Planctomycetota bacterium]